MSQNDVLKYEKVFFEGAKDKAVECDVVVPDSEPDISEVLVSDGQVYLTDCIVANGKITVRAKAVMNALCATEEERIVHLATVYELEQVFDADKTANDAKVVAEVENEYTVCKILNSRKVSFRSSVRVKVTATGNAETAIFNGGENIETLSGERSVAVVIGGEERTVRVGEDIELNDSFPNVKRVLFTNATAYPADEKIINNRVILKGIINVCTYFEGEDGTFNVLTSEIPFNHIFGIDGVDDNSACTVAVSLKNIEAEVYNDSAEKRRIIAYEAELLCSATAHGTVLAKFCKDAFSTVATSVLNTEKMRFLSLPCEALGTGDFSEKAKFDSPAAKIISVTSKACVSKTACANGFLTAYGDLFISALALGEDGRILSFEARRPFEVTTDAECGTECGMVCVTARIGRLRYNVTGADSIEIGGQVSINVRYACCETEEVVTSVKLNEAEKAGSTDDITLYYPEKSESFWNIGKRYRVSVTALKAVNGCEDEDVCALPLVLVPRM